MLQLLEIELTDPLLCMYYTQNEQNNSLQPRTSERNLKEGNLLLFSLSLSINQFDSAHVSEMYKLRIK